MSGITEKTAIVRAGLEALIARESAKRLAVLGVASQVFGRSTGADRRAAGVPMLVDTSIWVEHLRHGDATLSGLLNRGKVECHPFVIGELALGSLRRRSEVLTLLEKLPQLRVAGHAEVLAFID